MIIMSNQPTKQNRPTSGYVVDRQTNNETQRAFGAAPASWTPEIENRLLPSRFPTDAESDAAEVGFRRRHDASKRALGGGALNAFRDMSDEEAASMFADAGFED